MSIDMGETSLSHHQGDPVKAAADVIFRGQPDWRGYPPVAYADALKIAQTLARDGLLTGYGRQA